MSTRVLHVNSELAWRGGERQVELLTQYSSNQVHSIIACDPKGALHRRLSGKHEVSNLTIRNGFDLKAALRLKKLAKKADLIHCHTPKAQSIAILAKLLGCKKRVLCTKRTSFPIGNNFFSKLKYQKTDQLVCVSQASADVLQNQLPNVDIIVIHSAIERTESVAPIDLETLIPQTKNRTVIGYVAAISQEKNPQGFIDTAAAVISQNENCCFLWIGDGVLKKAVELQIDKLNLSNHIFLTGFQTNIQSWIAALDLLFFPSLSEGFPTTLLQAMQWSVPVIASDLPGIREIIVDDENGQICDAEDSGAFATKILKTLANDEFKSVLTNNAHKSMQSFYSEKMAEKYLNLYRKLMV